jgi:hypothetical protein
MGTRSKIAIENADGTVTAVYCHWDGYPEGNGKTLAEHYGHREKVQQLIDLGSLSSLDEFVFPEGEHSFQKPEDGVTVAYHRDRGEDLRQEQYPSVEHYLIADVEEYGYLFTTEGSWVYVDGNYSPLDRLSHIYNCSEITVK